jgi:hypothetical protein
MNVMSLKHVSFILLHPSYAFYALPSHDIHVQKLQNNENEIDIFFITKLLVTKFVKN